MRTLSKVLGASATLALVGIGVPAAVADTTIAPDATLVSAPYLQPIAYAGGTHNPGAYGLDVDGDKVADVFGYCVEPGVNTSSAVRSQTQILTAYDSASRSFIQDAGRTRWVAHNGFGAVAPTDLAAKAGITVNLAAGTTDVAMMQEATQAAIWRYSAGLSVPTTFKYGSTTADNTKFWAVYTYLVKNAVADDTKTTVYDEKSGEASTQAIIVVTPPAPEPSKTDEPTKVVTPAPEPTKTPCATDCTTTQPAWAPMPDALRVSTQVSYRITMSNNAYTPTYGGFDITGDKVADVYGYCVEPFVGDSTGVRSWTQKFASYNSTTRTDLKDAGRVRWVATHGYGAVPGEVIAQHAGITVNLTPGSTDISMLQAATQAAIWRFSSGLVVNPNWRFGYTTADNTKFWKVYNGLVNMAVPSDENVTILDSKPGEASTQGFVVVHPPTCPDACPTDPTKTTDPTKVG